MSSVPVVSASAKPRPYRRFLTSALHTRFVHAAIIALLWADITAFFSAGRNDFFWSWFPLGPAGIRAALFSIPSIMIFILQVATLRIGRRNAKSRLGTLKTALLQTSTYITFLWYWVSAFLFAEILVYSSPSSKKLGWVLRSDYGEPDRMNERPIYLRYFLMLLGSIQAISHVAYDQSSLHIPVMKASPHQVVDSRTHPDELIQVTMRNKMPYMVTRASVASIIATFIGPFLYTGVFRQWYWWAHVSFAKLIFNITRSEAAPPSGFYIGGILLEAFLWGCLVSFTWEISILLFQTYIIQEPTKKTIPLSASSKDPNGTLLNGLMAKRDIVQSFAFWELVIIAQKQPERRKMIFADFDRPGGAIWPFMLKAALKVIGRIDKNIDPKLDDLNQSPNVSAGSGAPQPKEIVLPKIIPEKQHDYDIFAARARTTGKAKVGKFIGDEFQQLGTVPNPWSPPIQQAGQRAYQYAKSPVDTRYSKVQAFLTQSSLRRLLTTTPARQTDGIVFGTPIANAAVVVDAIEAVTKMLTSSLNDDAYGRAVQGVPEAVKQFTRTIQLLEKAIRSQEQAGLSSEADIEEVAIVLGRLKTGLRELLSAFQVFLNDIGLGIRELNEAKRAAEERPILESQRAPQQPHQNGERHKDHREVQEAQEPPQIKESTEQPRRLFKTLERNGNENVFGARDLKSVPSRRKETEQVTR